MGHGQNLPRGHVFNSFFFSKSQNLRPTPFIRSVKSTMHYGTQLSLDEHILFRLNAIRSCTNNVLLCHTNYEKKVLPGDFLITVTGKNENEYLLTVTLR